MSEEDCPQCGHMKGFHLYWYGNVSGYRWGRCHWSWKPDHFCECAWYLEEPQVVM